MDDEMILKRGGNQDDINSYAERNGADLKKEGFIFLGAAFISTQYDFEVRVIVEGFTQRMVAVSFPATAEIQTYKRDWFEKNYKPVAEEEKMWQPRWQQEVWTLSSKGYVGQGIWNNSLKQQTKMKMGMVFKTENAAKKAKGLIQDLMKDFHAMKI